MSLTSETQCRIEVSKPAHEETKEKPRKTRKRLRPGERLHDGRIRGATGAQVLAASAALDEIVERIKQCRAELGLADGGEVADATPKAEGAKATYRIFLRAIQDAAVTLQ